MMIFTTFPAIAPALATGIIAAFGWRGIFGAFILFSLISALWLGLRQPETLPRAERRPLRLGPLWHALIEVVTHRVVATSIAVQTLAFATIFAALASVQPIYDVTFGMGESFPYWFAATALLAGTGSFVNARLVVRVGMRRMITVTLGAQILSSSVMTLLFGLGLVSGGVALAAFFVWITGVFLMASLVMGNLNALALEPMGHIAGMAASITGAISTVLSVVLAAPVGLAFNGTPVPVMGAVALFCALGFVLMKTMPRTT